MRQGDIFFISLDPTAGHEQAGRRPTLVISPSLFNRSAGTCIVLPVTSGGAFARNRGFAVPLPPGLQTSGFVLCHQPRTIDLAARDGRFVESVPATTLQECLSRLLSLLSTSIPQDL